MSKPNPLNLTPSVDKRIPVIPKHLNIPIRSSAHYAVKLALKESSFIVVRSMEDATLIVDGYLFYVLRMGTNPKTGEFGVAWGCDMLFEFRKPDGRIIYQIETTGFLPSPKIDNVLDCAKWVVDEFHKELKKKHKDLFVVISKEPTPK